MAWIETASLSFTARHDSSDGEAVEAMLERLERLRDDLAEHFVRTPGNVAVVVHPRQVELALAHPWLPLARLAAAPAARRYMAGWFASGEIHVLAPAALRERASRVPGSLEALELAPEHEYAHLTIGASNRGLPPPFAPGSFRRYLRWAWLCEGAAAHLAGQTPHLRPAISRRLYEGERPAFPPSTRDAQLLGATVFALLERERGRRACALLASWLHPQGPRAALAEAFGRPLDHVEHDWRKLLATMTTAPS